jgi:hypothetical protein
VQNSFKGSFFYVAPPFCGVAGHYFNYAHGLFQACRESGIPFLAIGASRIAGEPDFPGELPFQPLFHEPGALCVRGIRIRGLGRLRNYLLFRRSLKELQRHPGFGPGAFCLVEEPRLFNIAATTRWLGSLNRDKCPRLGFLFRYGLRSADGFRWLPMRDAHLPMLKTLEAAARRLPITLLSDSHIVAAHLRELTSLSIRVIPVHFEIPTEGVTGIPAQTHPGVVHFYMPGVAAKTKGTSLLVEALRILKNAPAMARMRFTIPFYPIPNANPEMDEARAVVESLRLPNVEILYQGLGREEYYDRLLRADVILTPYDPDRYQATSGPFAEALALGKPVVTSGNTWMSAMLNLGHGAGLTFRFGDARGLADTLVLASSRLPELSHSARLARSSWREKNGSEAILDAIFKNNSHARPF